MNTSALFKEEKPWLLGIIILGIILRFYQFDQWSLSNDELSTLFRASFPTLSDVIKHGILTDNHPALSHFFTFYWIKLFGNSPFALRLPFLLFGIGSFIFYKKIAYSLLNKNAALFSLSIFTVSQFFILYSQIARPYILGLFFTLSFTYYWSQVIFKTSKKMNWLLFVICAILGSISHYLATFSILLVYLSGFLFVDKKRMLHYFISGVAILILFIPHLNITIEQLSHKSLTWLSIPKPNFILTFLDFTFNGSFFLKLLVSLVFIISIFFANYKSKRINTERLVFLLLFTIPYLVSYFYSVYVGSILQYSILIFSFPFLLLFIGSFINDNISIKYTLVTCFLIIIIGIQSLIFEVDFYNKKPFSNFKGVIENALSIKSKYTQNKILSFSNSNNPEYLNYYFKQFNDSIAFSINNFSDEKSIAAARDSIEKSDKEYVLTSFANAVIPAEVHELIKLKYPVIVEEHRFFNSETKLYGKGNLNRKKLFHTSFLDYTFNSKWNVASDFLQDSVFFEKAPSYKMFAEHEFVLNYKDTVKNLFQGKNNFLTIKAKIKAISNKNFILVVSIDRNGENIQWRGINVNTYLKESEWAQFLSVFQKTDEIIDTDLISIYFWNPEKSSASIEAFEITNFKDSDYNYYD